MTDPAGLCPHLDEPGIGYQVDARHCNGLVNRLRSWNINVVWDETSIPQLQCVSETVQNAINQAQGVRQRWTTNEVLAIYNAFRIFKKAHETFLTFVDAATQYGISFPYNYEFPLAQAITYEKRKFAAYGQAPIQTDNNYNSENPSASENPIGVHYYSGGTPETTRRIVLSASRWGEANSNMTMQSRSWLVLHEFSHIFAKDRVSGLRPDFLNAVESEYPNILLELFEGNADLQGSPTHYSTRGIPGGAGDNLGKEYLIEAVTGTIWNYGYNEVPGYDSSAGGWTGAIGKPQTITVSNIDVTLKNVRNIRGLERWILFNVIATV